MMSLLLTLLCPSRLGLCVHVTGGFGFGSEILTHLNGACGSRPGDCDMRNVSCMGTSHCSCLPFTITMLLDVPYKPFTRMFIKC